MKFLFLTESFSLPLSLFLLKTNPKMSPLSSHSSPASARGTCLQFFSSHFLLNYIQFGLCPIVSPKFIIYKITNTLFLTKTDG